MDEVNLLDGLDLDLPPAPGGAPAAGADAHQFFGTYQLIHQVGSGGVAKVFRARHIHPNYADKTFAIKIMHEEVSRDPKVVELFRHEAYVLSLLKHPNIVETFEAGSQDEKLFIAMEFIDGRDLDNMLQRCQKTKVKLPIPVALHIGTEALKALAYAHDLCDSDGNSLKLVHRDVNPSNVFLSYDGRVKLGDFGVADIAAGRIEKERQTAGKLGYFAPEQLDDGVADQRSDLFSMGVMLFELLCGERLFQGESTEEMIKANRKAKIPRPSTINTDITKGLEAVVLKALERKPTDRFSSSREMAQAIQPHLSEPNGMPLAVAALLRKAFLTEHIHEMQLREGLDGGKVTRGSGQLVAVCTADERAQAAFNELFLSRGYRVEMHESVATLGPSFSQQAPNALLVDVGSAQFNADTCAAALEGAPRPIAVVAVAEQLDMPALACADRVGAVDLLFKPFNIERVLTAVRAAIAGALKVATIDPGAVGVVEELVKPRVLVMSKDPTLAARLTTALAQRNYEFDVSATSGEALQRATHASYHAVVYDAHPASPADRFFAGQFRSAPGMGIVPILYLAAPESHALFAGVDADRSAVRRRDDPPAVLLETLRRLRADNRLGRIFLRYPTSFPVEIRYGGRVFKGEAVDVSRGGIMIVFGEQMPPVGTAVGLSLRLPTASLAIEVNGRVARVDLNKTDGNTSRIGVEFERFASRTESELIKFLASLDKSNPARRNTMIIGAQTQQRS
jgi:eukaryotic-like serine/threonine-protein kinase